MPGLGLSQKQRCCGRRDIGATVTQVCQTKGIPPHFGGGGRWVEVDLLETRGSQGLQPGKKEVGGFGGHRRAVETPALPLRRGGSAAMLMPGCTSPAMGQRRDAPAILSGLGWCPLPPRAGKGLIFQLYLPVGQKSCQDLLGRWLEMAGKCLASAVLRCLARRQTTSPFPPRGSPNPTPWLPLI